MSEREHKCRHGNKLKRQLKHAKLFESSNRIFFKPSQFCKKIFFFFLIMSNSAGTIATEIASFKQGRACWLDGRRGAAHDQSSACWSSDRAHAAVPMHLELLELKY